MRKLYYITISRSRSHRKSSWSTWPTDAGVLVVLAAVTTLGRATGRGGLAGAIGRDAVCLVSRSDCVGDDDSGTVLGDEERDVDDDEDGDMDDAVGSAGDVERFVGDGVFANVVR